MSTQPEISRVEIRVEGRVQGVGFRYFVVQQAQSLSLTGWTRNMPDGSVEVVAEGRKDSLLSFVGKVKQGPSSAMVSKQDVNWAAASGEYGAFEIWR